MDPPVHDLAMSVVAALAMIALVHGSALPSRDSPSPEVVLQCNRTLLPGSALRLTQKLDYSGRDPVS